MLKSILRLGYKSKLVGHIRRRHYNEAFEWDYSEAYPVNDTTIMTRPRHQPKLYIPDLSLLNVLSEPPDVDLVMPLPEITPSRFQTTLDQLGALRAIDWLHDQQWQAMHLNLVLDETEN